MTIIEILNQYGFATLAAIAMGYFIYFIYKFTTENIKAKLGNQSNWSLNAFGASNDGFREF